MIRRSSSACSLVCFLGLVGAPVAVVAACGGGTTPSDSTTDASVVTPFDSGTPESPDAAGTTSSDGAADAPDDAPSGTLLAPLIDTIETTASGVMIGWTNRTPDCDFVVGERKTALEGYAQKFSVPGTTTQTLDTTSTSVANASGSNCTYRLICKKGGAVSPYSDEQTTGCAL